jgi:hypothetical protein
MNVQLFELCASPDDVTKALQERFLTVKMSMYSPDAMRALFRTGQCKALTLKGEFHEKDDYWFGSRRSHVPHTYCGLRAD